MLLAVNAPTLAPKLVSLNAVLDVTKIHAESNNSSLLAACFRMWQAEFGWQGC